MWFEIAFVAVFLLAGQTFFGHFEEGVPRWRQWLKHLFAISLLVSISYFFGRFWFWTALIAACVPPLFIHAWWLPKHGINGWTGEPKDKYYELRRWNKK